MKESKLKKCKMPGCDKEVYDKKSLFCGEHLRAFREFRKNAGIGLSVSASVAVFIAKKFVKFK